MNVATRRPLSAADLNFNPARFPLERLADFAREPRLKGGRVAERREPQRLAAAERRARQPTEQPHHVARAVRGGDPLEVLARSRGDDARHGQVRRVTLQVAQRRDLKVHSALAFSGRGDLQHVARAVRGIHLGVLVALAVERRELALDAPVLAREVRELSERKPGGIEVEVHGAERPLRGDIHRYGSVADQIAAGVDAV